MADPDPSALREAATHRGYRLQRSRKKTPGVGDFGKYGLTNAKGKPVLGIGDKGLTASADEVEAFLRSGETATWRQSAAMPADRRKRAAAPRADDIPVPQPSRAPKSQKAHKATEVTAKPAPRSKATPPPELLIRAADPDEIGAIARFVAANGGGTQATITKRIAALIDGSGGIVVAKRGGIIGCLAWAMVPALDREPVARIVTLLVAPKHRREGIGRGLVEEFGALLAAAGHREVEAMSAIEIRSAHGFFRKLGFEETSYRFAQTLRKAPGKRDR